MITWLDPADCEPPHRVTHPEKHAELTRAFTEQQGWGAGYPALVGYAHVSGTVRLLTGSHRWAAAQEAGIKIPVCVKPLLAAEAAWGDLDAWIVLLQSDTV